MDNSLFERRKKHTKTWVHTIHSNVAIQQVHEITDLGVILDEKMPFKNQIDHVISRAQSFLAWIKRFACHFDDPWVIKKLYMMYVLPVLEYANHSANILYFSINKGQDKFTIIVK